MEATASRQGNAVCVGMSISEFLNSCESASAGSVPGDAIRSLVGAGIARPPPARSSCAVSKVPAAGTVSGPAAHEQGTEDTPWASSVTRDYACKKRKGSETSLWASDSMDKEDLDGAGREVDRAHWPHTEAATLGFPLTRPHLPLPKSLEKFSGLFHTLAQACTEPSGHSSAQNGASPLPIGAAQPSSVSAEAAAAICAPAHIVAHDSSSSASTAMSIRCSQAEADLLANQMASAHTHTHSHTQCVCVCVQRTHAHTARAHTRVRARARAHTHTHTHTHTHSQELAGRERVASRPDGRA